MDFIIYGEFVECLHNMGPFPISTCWQSRKTFSYVFPSTFSSVIKLDQMLVPDTVFFASEEKSSSKQEEMEDVEKQEEQSKYNRQRCNSDSILRATNPEEIRRGHEQLCIRRAEAVKQRGISLLNEVDAQYSALQVVYSQHI